MDKILEELKLRKGEAEGMRIYRTIMPGIMADFNRMLQEAGVGETISEEYRIDDGSGTVVLEGERLADGSVNVRRHLDV